jgi:hypothetical protein
VSAAVFGGPKLAGYIHPASHARLLAQLEGGGRLSLGPLDVELVLGGGGTFMARAAPTYALIDGELERRRLAGQWGWMPSAAVGLAGPLPRRENLRWFIRPTMLIQTPYNAGSAPFAVLELGARWRR